MATLHIHTNMRSYKPKVYIPLSQDPLYNLFLRAFYLRTPCQRKDASQTNVDYLQAQKPGVLHPAFTTSLPQPSPR